MLTAPVGRQMSETSDSGATYDSDRRIAEKRGKKEPEVTLLELQACAVLHV